MGTAMRARSFATLVLLLLLTFARGARADRELLVQTGEQGQISADGLAGFRTGLYSDTAYQGLVGASMRETKLLGQSVTELRAYVAPSFDVFAVEKVSVGLAAEFGARKLGPQNAKLDFAFMPRAGYSIRATDRIAVWPRLGLGYVSKLDPSVQRRFSGFVTRIDIGLLYRINEVFYIRTAPELSFTFSGHEDAVPSIVPSGPSPASVESSRFEVSLSSSVGVFF
jgi:hypothetical protein